MTYILLFFFSMHHIYIVYTFNVFNNNLSVSTHAEIIVHSYKYWTVHSYKYWTVHSYKYWTVHSCKNVQLFPREWRQTNDSMDGRNLFL